jgi:hypothetical protein
MSLMGWSDAYYDASTTLGAQGVEKEGDLQRQRSGQPDCSNTLRTGTTYQWYNMIGTVSLHS